jgi:HEAT repeat protein
MVYVSSTIADLAAERQAVLDWLRLARHQAVDSYRPDSGTVRDSCLDDIAACDLYVLILGHRYGFQPLDDNPEELSITHLEFRRAGECGIPRVALLRTSNPDEAVSDLGEPQQLALVSAFRDEVARQVRPGQFSDLQGLIQGLSTGVQNELDKLGRRAKARAAGREPVSPEEFRADLIQMMDALAAQARTGRMPTFLPAGADVSALTRTVRVRSSIRSVVNRDRSDAIVGRQDASGRYRLVTEQAHDGVELQLWPEIVAKHACLVVLGDPGLGKSWLIRTETLRLARAARADLGYFPHRAVLVPVPLRCDQLDAAPGADLAAKVAEHLTAQGLLPGRSRERLAAKIRTGEAVLLLDAADELTPEASGRVRDTLARWADAPTGSARCVITSRIAGYTGSPVPGAVEVELQPFSNDDVAGVVTAWQLPPTAVARLKERLQDPAIAEMARIPLMLALLCSLAAQAAAGHSLPRTRGQLYERVLRWFLTGAHRSRDSPAALIRDSVAVDAMLEILAPLAFAFATTPGGWTDLMPGEQVLKAIRAVGPAFTEQGRTAADVLGQLSSDAGVLIPDSDPTAGRSPHYLFLHRTFAEYLVARHLATLAPQDWLAVVEQHHWFDPDWAEVIPMLAERLSPADAAALINYLASCEPDPFHHSLQAAARAWGARPDADHLLTDPRAADLSERIAGLLRHRPATALSQLKAMTFLPKPFLSALLAKLSDDDGSVRRTAVTMVADRDSPAVTKALLARLGDDDERVRAAAVQGLTGRDAPGMTEALLAWLDADNGDIRAAAVEALADRDAPGVTEALLAQLNGYQHYSPYLRVAAMKALAERDALGVTEALITQFDELDDSVFGWAIKVLATRDFPGVTEALIASLGRSGWYGAMLALAERDAPGVTEALLARLDHGDSTVRWHASTALADRKSAIVTEALLARLSDDDERVRAAAVQALADRDVPGIAEALLARLSDDDERVRAAAVQALADRDVPGIAEALLARLSDDDERVRAAAVQALASRDSPEVTETLLARLDAGERDVRVAAVQALASRDASGATEALLARLRDEDWFVRAAAVQALADRDVPGIAEALLARLSDDDEYVRTAAVKALTDRDIPGVAEALIIRLYDPHEEEPVQQAAAEALASRNSPEVTEALLTRLTRLNDDRDRAWAAAVKNLPDRISPEMMEDYAYWSDHTMDVRAAVVKALAGRDSPEVTKALLAQLSDRTWRVRAAAVGALIESPSPQALLTVADHHSLFASSNLDVVAEQLMMLYYLRIKPEERSRVRAAMAQLTAGDG